MGAVLATVILDLLSDGVLLVDEVKPDSITSELEGRRATGGGGGEVGSRRPRGVSRGGEGGCDFNCTIRFI